MKALLLAELSAVMMIGQLRAALRRLVSGAARPDWTWRVERFRKPTFTKPAPIDLRHEIATKCDVVIEALAD